MSARVPIAFYAPLKSPSHPAPSGDRTMARLLLEALSQAGFSPELASEFRSFDKAGNRQLQETLKAQGEAEADRLIARYRALHPEARPRAWFTYHVYYKAPDWIGPAVADALGIPYAIAEGSRAAKRAGGPWAVGHAGAEAALDRADMLLVMTATDRVALERQRPHRQTLVDLPPFLDAQDWHRTGPLPDRASTAEARLLTVAMMRDGDKLHSYRILAEALSRVAKLSWTLDIVGDGDARDAVERLFAEFGARVRLHGRVDNRDALRVLYEAADLFVWPAVNEAYGMVLLEAQALGCPVVAGAYGGVSSVVRDEVTGMLTSPGDAGDFAAAVEALAADPERRRALGEAARRFVLQERNLASAAKILRDSMMPLVGAQP